jgi:putative spermidine/putrescine transport system permease protein
MATDTRPATVASLARTTRTASGLERAAIPALLLGPALIWIGIFFLLPLGLMIWQSLAAHGFSLDVYRSLFTTPIYARALVTTFEISIITTLGCLILGYPVAYFLASSGPVLRGIVLILVIIPYWLDYVVRNFSWLILLGRRGLINRLLEDVGLVSGPLDLLYNLFSVLVGMVQVMLPLMILTLFGAMLRIDRQLVAAAEIHGARPWRAFWAVFFPLSLPGVYAACPLVFILALGFYITPALLGSPRETMISQIIMLIATELLDWPLACAAGALLLSVTVVVVVVYNRTFSIERLWGGREA